MKHKKSLDSEVVPLHLIFDYPVHWSKFKVLRDLLQNFYDAVGHREWHRRFSWQCEGGRLQLNAQDVGFSHDWLLHIGASTKREAIGEYAGYFGEGFKIAALCALRDHDWQIELASRDWRLQVTTEPVRVWMGMAVSQPCRDPVKNPRGWMIRHRLSSVALMPGLFRAERGPEALSTYLHELAHCFGGDQSGSFAQALTGMLEVVLDHPEDLMTFRRAWDVACRIDSA